jgi:hypothetical protein
MNASYHGKKRDGVTGREERPRAKRVVEGGSGGTCHLCHGTSVRVVRSTIEQAVQPQEAGDLAQRCDKEKLEEVSEGGW